MCERNRLILNVMKRLQIVLATVFALCIAVVANAQDAGSDRVYRVGDLYEEDGLKGIVIQVSEDGKHGKIMSIDQAKLCWCDRATTYVKSGENVITKAHDLDDGELNTNTVMSLDGVEDYKAFVWCRAKGDRWYLPSLREVRRIFDGRKVIKATIKKNKFEKLSGVWFLSSSEVGDEFASGGKSYSKNFAWVLSMTAGQPAHMAKDEGSVFVRAVAKF